MEPPARTLSSAACAQAIGDRTSVRPSSDAVIEDLLMDASQTVAAPTAPCCFPSRLTCSNSLAFRPVSPRSADERILDIVVEEFALRFRVEEVDVNFQRNV